MYVTTELSAHGSGMICATTSNEFGRAATIWSTSWPNLSEAPVRELGKSFVPICKRTICGEPLSAFEEVAMPVIWAIVHPGWPSLLEGNGMPLTVAGPSDWLPRKVICRLS